MPNPLGSPRTFHGTPADGSPNKTLQVFQAGSQAAAQSESALESSPRARKVDVKGGMKNVGMRDPRSPQTRNALWDPLHDWSQEDRADEFEHRAGGAPGSVTNAGHGRIKKRSNAAEVRFYKSLGAEPSMESLAPTFCGSHVSDGSDWTAYAVLEDITVPFSKPAVLDVQIGYNHVGGGEAGSAPGIGLRINGMRVHANQGLVVHDKTWGGNVSVNGFWEALEEFFTDASGTVRSDVARTLLSSIDRVIEWVEAQSQVRLNGTSLLVVYEGDLTQASPAGPVVKMIDFEHVVTDADVGVDEDYLGGIRNLRWMTERLEAHSSLHTGLRECDAGRRELSEARAQLKNTRSATETAGKQALENSPTKGYSESKLLHEDIIKDDVAMSVTEQEDAVIAAFLKSVLAKHDINPGQEAFVELLKWKYEPLIMDRVYLKDMFDKYGLNTHALDDVLKWKATTSCRLRELRYIYDAKLSAGSVLPSYYDLLVTGEETRVLLAPDS